MKSIALKGKLIIGGVAIILILLVAFIARRIKEQLNMNLYRRDSCGLQENL
jgi:hypothetical protein